MNSSAMLKHAERLKGSDNQSGLGHEIKCLDDVITKMDILSLPQELYDGYDDNVKHLTSSRRHDDVCKLIEEVVKQRANRWCSENEEYNDITDYAALCNRPKMASECDGVAFITKMNPLSMDIPTMFPRVKFNGLSLCIYYSCGNTICLGNSPYYYHYYSYNCSYFLFDHIITRLLFESQCEFPMSHGRVQISSCLLNDNNNINNSNNTTNLFSRHCSSSFCSKWIYGYQLQNIPHSNHPNASAPMLSFNDTHFSNVSKYRSHQTVVHDIILSPNCNIIIPGGNYIIHSIPRTSHTQMFDHEAMVTENKVYLQKEIRLQEGSTIMNQRHEEDNLASNSTSLTSQSQTSFTKISNFKSGSTKTTTTLSSSFLSSSVSLALSSSSSSSSPPSSSSSPSSWSAASSVLRIFILFLLIVSSMSRPPKARENRVNIHAIIPRHFGMTNELSREFRNTVVNFMRDRRSQRLQQVFSVKEDISILKDDTPMEILDTFCEKVLNGQTVAIININNPLGMRRRSSSSRYILNLAQYWGIPIISWDTEFSGTPQADSEYRTLQLAPTVGHQVRAMVSLLDRYNWTHFSIVTSRVAGDTEFVASLENIVEISQNMPPNPNGIRRESLEILSTVHIDDYKKSKERLSKFVGSDSRVFLLHCSSKASYDILSAATSLGLTGRDYVWILTRSCIPSGKFAPKEFPVGLLGVSFDYGLEAMKVVLRVSIKTWLNALKDMSLKPAMVKNLDIPPSLSCQTQDKQFWRDGRVLYDYMLNTTIPDQPEIVFNKNGTLQKTEISIINLQWYDGKRLRTQWKEVGRWKRYGLKMKDITWPGGSPMAPPGKPKRAFVRIATLYEMPYVVYRNVTDDGTCDENALPCHIYVRDDNKNILQNNTLLKCCVGLTMDLLKILSNELNFDYHLVEVKDGNWGGTDADGNWNGLVKALMDGECDMVLTSMKINPERASAVQFSVPYLETGIKIIVALRDGAISPTAFLEPYDYASWSLILIFSVHATGSSILIFEWLSPKGLNRGLTPLREHKFSLFRSFWLIWAMLFSTSVQTDSPRGIASRFLANIWALFALVFLASYTANLAAFMITKEEYYDLSGIKDYRLQNPYVMNPPFKYATTAYGSTEAMLKSNHQYMYNYMKRLNVPDVKTGIRALKSGEIQAFIYDSSVLEYYASRDPKCRLVTVGNRYAMTGYGVGFPPDPNNPWIGKVNKVILKLQENGELDRLQRFWLAGACDTKKEAGVSNRTLGILNFTSAFILLGTGILLGLLLLVTEHFYFKFGRKYLRNMDKCGCCALVSLSMGRSLRLQDTVSEAMTLVAKNRCKDPICETQMWKLKHKLDMALLKIENLEMQLSLSGDEIDNTSPRSIMGTTTLYDPSGFLSNHTQDNMAIQQQPQPRQALLQQQPHTSHSLTNNIGNHNAYMRRPTGTGTIPMTSSPYSPNSSSVFQVHPIPEVTYCKDINGGSCHINSPSTNNTETQEDIMGSPSTILDQPSTQPVTLVTGKFHQEFPPSYNDCLNEGFHHDDGQYAPFNVLDDIDSECGSTHSTTTTSLGAAATGKISPWPGLKRSPSYTSAVGGSFGSDVDRNSPNANKSRKYEGKTYMGVSGLSL